VLVANPGTMSHGLTLTAASVIVWFSPIHSAEIYEQANARIVRPGQKRNTLIVRMEGSDLERRMYDKLQTRTKVQGTLLSMFEK
jgi:SNF2 family DNA or RNA helicase